MPRDLDVVLFGATGQTGRLVAQHLFAHAPDTRWALAGRDLARLADLRDRLALDPRDLDRARAIPLIAADVRDARAVDAIARRAHVVCTTVGPYAPFGLALVEACAAHGTHHCDVTGETPYVRASIDRAHASAERSGARIVHCCGFDSIPSDLGVFLLHDHVTKLGDRLASTRYRVVSLQGGLSAGTLATMIALFAASADPAVRALLTNPYALDPHDHAETSREPSHARDQLGPRLDLETGRWTAPFVMAPINTRVVRRTDALLDHAYGPNFRYDEALELGPGPAGFARAIAVSTALATLYTAAVTPISRAILSRVLPQFGRDDDDARGSFRVEIRATTEQARRLRVVIAGDVDPGYAASAIMLAESALSLAHDPLTSPGGVLTPAIAMGHALATRLRTAGLTLSVQAPRDALATPERSPSPRAD